MVPKPKIKFAFHVHSNASRDSLSNPKAIIEHCRKSGIDIVAICDHNRIEGAESVRRLSNGSPQVIIGEEINTAEGEIIGLFLRNRIANNLPLLETVSQIRKQNGLVCLPHPGEQLRRSSLKKKRVLEIINQIDMVEVFNCRTLFKTDDNWALKVADRYHKIALAGSDAHSVKFISLAINELPAFTNQQEFLVSARENKILAARKSGLSDQLKSLIVRMVKKG